MAIKSNNDITPTTKQCTTCNIEKPLSDYAILGAGKFCRSARCKACANAYQSKLNFHKNKKRHKTKSEERARINGIGLDVHLCHQFLNVTPSRDVANGFYDTLDSRRVNHKPKFTGASSCG